MTIMQTYVQHENEGPLLVFENRVDVLNVKPFMNLEFFLIAALILMVYSMKMDGNLSLPIGDIICT